jgi:hypothetical protein
MRGCTDCVAQSLNTAHLATLLCLGFAFDAFVCTDGSAPLTTAARLLDLEHRWINAVAGARVAALGCSNPVVA